MVKTNLKIKVTCFLCRYEITKHNKSSYQIKYNKHNKPICRYCTKNKHKILEDKYKNFDMQCKSCNKPSKFKKCIACSICNHLFHGKCLKLNKTDIEKIDQVCNFFMCKLCSSETLPNLPDSEQNPKSKNNTKSKYKQCFTCDNTVPKYNYLNKHLLYGDKTYSLCEKCSKLNVNIPVKDKTLIEFQDCSICNKQVKYESIFCNLCQHLVHPYCNGINKQNLSELSKSDEDWYCLNCNLKIYPNYLLNNEIKPKTKFDKSKAIKEFTTFKDCSVCSKNVTGNETLACSMCNHWVHKKCIGIFKNRAEFQDFLHYYSTKPWDCPTCTANMLPFIFLDNNKFHMLLMDMYTKPTYLNKDNIETTYTKLKDRQFYNPKDNALDNNDRKLDKQLNDIDPDLNYLFNDTCITHTTLMTLK